MGHDASGGEIPPHLWKPRHGTAPQLSHVMSQIAHFLDQLGYSKTVSNLQKEFSKRGLSVNVSNWMQSDHFIPLMDLYQHSRDGTIKKGEEGSAEDSSSEDSSVGDESEESDDGEESDEDEENNSVEGLLVDVEAEETSDDDDDNDSGGNRREKIQNSTKGLGVKRKRVLTPSSSSEDTSDSGDSNSSSDSDGPGDKLDRPAKKAKIDDSDSSSASDTHSDSESDSVASSISSSRSSDSSESESDGDSSSSSDSDSESGSDASSSSNSLQAKKVAKPTKAKPRASQSAALTTELADIQERSSSTSSTTLDGEPNAKAGAAKGLKPSDLTDESASSEAPAHDNIHPDRLKRVPGKQENTKQFKKQQVPFSRIPVNQKVDPRFASNDYIPYDYANRAYQDLVVTKGKGFTKEKNKKKRGAYRGGTIDLAPKGIKFDD